MHNFAIGRDRKSAGFIVALKPGNAGGAKGPYHVYANVRRQEGCLNDATTSFQNRGRGIGSDQAETYRPGDADLAEGLSSET